MSPLMSRMELVNSSELALGSTMTETLDPRVSSSELSMISHRQCGRTESSSPSLVSSFEQYAQRRPGGLD
ncbi:hypothetical protein AQJ84_17470 [Streptomyces resistomycificus]|uniref:Uncharacterized protein n=1 Tax=Streptomyces resistomycificus TaxID=67356 RepID=A0A0L8KYZ1_9ACTN|nr:hypothetical protein ADK37_32445 [Streptomyces resistomycificus]KUN97039.1 hypothetical protein AQJ84_17470 [Streptomyces resistomycificus]